MKKLILVHVTMLVSIVVSLVMCLLSALKVSTVKVTTTLLVRNAILQEGQGGHLRQKYVIFAGTGTEIIKTAPVVLAMKKANLSVHVVFTGNNPHIAAPFRKIWDINFDTVVHDGDQTMPSFTGNLVSQIEKVITPHERHVWIVQGDTSTAFAASTVAFLRRTPIIHLDSGSRMLDDSAPFQDEFYRRATALATSAHIAPTELVRERLLQQRVHPERILVLGASSLDATRLAQPRLQPPTEVIGLATRLVLVTLHRRDSLHDLLEVIGQTPANINITFVVPAHPDPSATKAASAACSQNHHILCVARLEYFQSQWMLKHSVLIITDLRDLEEEATWYGRAVLVFGTATERPKGIDAGSTMLVPNAKMLRNVLPELIQKPKAPRLQAMEALSHPFGKGTMSDLLVDYFQDPSFQELLAKPVRMTAMATAVRKYKYLPLDLQAATWQGSTIISYSSTEKVSSVSSTGKVSTPSSSVCSMEISTDENIWIAMAAWKNTNHLHRALRSLEAQSDTAGYKTIKTVVFEDYSENMFSEQDKAKHPRSEKFEVIYMRESEKIQRGSAFAMDRLFSYIGEHALPHEYVLVMDGDDTLADDDTLRYIHEKFNKHKPWFAWGRHNGKYRNQCRDLSAEGWKDIRHAVWSFCFPRIFQSHLLQHLDVGDLKGSDGTWLQRATDRAFIYKFMEISGPKRSLYLGEERALYNYTYSASKRISISGEKEYLIDMKPSPVGEENVHVIACVFNRNNTNGFLEALMESKAPESSSYTINFHFHICNNNQRRQDELEVLAKSIGKLSKHTLTIHKMGYNVRGLARFMLAQHIMLETYVDYIIMLDDDQYVLNTTLAEIYAEREPQTYKTWYGKNWKDSKEKKDYWKGCDMITSDPNRRFKLRPQVKTWQYGGTGMSIIDASIFRVYQLFDLEHKYMFVEDMWLSYIVQLLGWRIERLFVRFRDNGGMAYANNTGQYTSLREVKNELFEKVGYLNCVPYRGCSSTSTG